MNWHPALVHFPIALLTIYALMECLRFKKIMAWEPWFYLKASFVILGFLSSIVTYMSGDQIQRQFRKTAGLTTLIHAHSNYAYATVLVFGLISVAYAIVWLKWKPLEAIARRLLSGYIVVPLALIGLALVTITGALGGAIAFGPEIDPVVSFITHGLGY
jgi:uncharacterized membrane protein